MKKKQKEFWLRSKDSVLKFRIWSKYQKKFLTIGDMKNDMFSWDEDHWIIDNGKDEIVQQYTGYKDINGKEIFEGDILETDEAGWIAIVVYGSGMFMLEDKSGGFSSYVNWGGCKILGNAYENPELIKKL